MPCDYKKYPPNWSTEIRPFVLKREGNCCKSCGVRNHHHIFRGTLYGEEVYQYADGSTYSYPQNKLLGKELFDIQPFGGISQKAIKIVLTIAHLDHDEQNHEVSYDRLAALCQKCHLRYDAKEKVKRRASKKYSASLFPNP